MEELRSELWDYYGQQNEIRAGVKPKPEEYIPRPEALRRYDMAKSLGVPYVAGGLEDQPYLWMQEHGVILGWLAEREAVEMAQAKAFAESQNARKH